MKTCTTCSIRKPFESFHRNVRSQDGRHCICKDCRKIYYDRTYIRTRLYDPTKPITCTQCGETKDPADFYKRSKQRRHSRCKCCESQNSASRRAADPDRLAVDKNRRLANPVSRLLAAAKQRAKKCSVPFSISHQHVVIPKYCPVFGVELKVNDGMRGPDSPSLDRFIPSLGYVEGNVWVISSRANHLKNDGQLREFEMLIDAMKNFGS